MHMLAFWIFGLLIFLRHSSFVFFPLVCGADLKNVARSLRDPAVATCHFRSGNELRAQPARREPTGNPNSRSEFWRIQRQIGSLSSGEFGDESGEMHTSPKRQQGRENALPRWPFGLVFSRAVVGGSGYMSPGYLTWTAGSGGRHAERRGYVARILRDDRIGKRSCISATAA
jgi:hypothetical protein